MAEIDAKYWLESVTLDEDDMASDSDTDVATQQSIKAYVDNEIDTINSTYATKTYVDDADALKQDALTNGADLLTQTEINQIDNINDILISPTSWGVVSGLVGSPTPRLLDTNPNSSWPYAYVPLTPTFDTDTENGSMVFYLWQDNHTTSSEYAEINIHIPVDCYYDGSSNPPHMSVLTQGVGTQKFNRLIASNNGTTGEVKFYLEIANNGDGILDLYCRDEAQTMLPTLLTSETNTETLANITDPLPIWRRRRVNNYASGGVVKINSNGDASKPTYTTVGGTPQQVTYTNPILASTTVFPGVGPFDNTNIYDSVNNIFLEQPVIGMPQYWRFSFSYSGKSINSSAGFYLRVTNPISGFSRRLLLTLPIGETSNSFLTVDVSTYADSASLAPPLGTGLGGYQFWLETQTSNLVIVVEDIARFTSTF